VLKNWRDYWIIKKSGLFDPIYYLMNNPDVRRADVDPLMHFVKYGWKEGRNPSSEFNTQFYLENNNDVKISNINPLIHYLKFGKKEGRKISNGQFEKSIAIHIHIYYEDLIDEFVSYLNNMPYTYDLYISVPNKQVQKKCEKKFYNLPHLNKLVVKQVINRGRDMAPFFCTFGNQLQYYDFIGHFHTKKSLYNKGATQGWRNYLCNALLGSQEQIKSIFSIFQTNNEIGLIYPQTYYRLPYWAHTWLANEAIGKVWCNRLGINNFPKGYFDFPVGSMFWARSEALAPLFQAGIQLKDFQEESGQTDGTLAHCLERLIGLCTSSLGMKHEIIKDMEHPSWSSWRFDQFFNRQYEEIRKLLNSPEIKLICFDIFDTLLIRPLLDPESVKTIVAYRMGGEAGKVYKTFRSDAEEQARFKKGSDVCLKEIFEQLGEMTNLTETQLMRLKNLEEEIELLSVQPRIEALHLFTDAIATGKPVILVTDMFLDRDLIKKCLTKNDIEGWKELFVSNDVGLRKDSGQMYDYILNKYSYSSNAILMIGDNERSDVQIPDDIGISFIHLIKPVEIARGLPRFSDIIKKFEHCGDINAEITLGLVVQKNFSDITYNDYDPQCFVKVTPFNIGYSIVGPLLTSFAQWLINISNNDNIEQLYFLSREGKIIKDVYDYWCEGLNNVPKSEYLELSRRATSVSSISNFSDIAEIAKFPYYTNSIEEFIKIRFGLILDPSQWKDIFNKFNIDRHTKIKIEDKRIENIIPLLKYLEPQILAQSRKEKQGLIQYLDRKGLTSDINKAVVDIGYGGTIQRNLNSLLAEKIHGYYLMTDERSKNVSSIYKVKTRGCFGENLTRNSDAPFIYRESFTLEKLLSANDPQIEYYELINNDKTINHYRELSLNEIKPTEIRTRLQQGVLEYVKDAKQIRNDVFPEFIPSIPVAKMITESFLTKQCPSEKNFISSIILDDYYCGRGLV